MFSQVVIVLIPQDGCAIGGQETIRARPYLSDDLIWAFLVGCELIMFACICYGFRVVKNKVSNLDWLQLHCSVMEMRNAKLMKCFSNESISSDRGEEIQGFLERCVV